MERIGMHNGTGDEPGNWLYCEDGYKNKYVFYRGHPAFLAKITGAGECSVEGMEERFSFSDPYCRQLMEIAERKGNNWFKNSRQCH